MTESNLSKRISVVIALYNKEKSIYSTIKSVLSQTYKHFELIIVNDGSTDNSLEIVKSFLDSRIRVINKLNGGVSSARNKGIQESQYEYIAFLDADDLWEDTFLADMCSLIQKCPEALLVGSSYCYLNENYEIIDVINNLPENYTGYLSDYFKIALKNMLYTSSSSVYKKIAFNHLGLFDETLSQGEDIDMFIRFALSEKIAFYNKPLVQYRLGAENRAASLVFERNKYLIWNLSRYAEYEKRNSDFKIFIDRYRLAGVREYLSGKKNVVNEIETLLADIDLKKLPLFWSVIRFMPDNIRAYMYKLRVLMYKSYYNYLSKSKFY